MKGKSVFTQQEWEKILSLVKEKVKATPAVQKGIRNRIRKLGFYYSDFSGDKSGYDVADLENLVKAGSITLSGSHLQNNDNLIQSNISIDEIKKSGTESKHELKSMSEAENIKNDIVMSRFDPASGKAAYLPHKCGNYVICLKQGAELPEVSVKPEFQEYNGLRVLYTGIAGKSLRNRDFRQHFTGNNAGRSTLRKSLGVLFGYTQVPRDRGIENGKTKFSDTDESALTEWMKNNLVMYYLENQDYESLEAQLINQFNPPLNLKGNSNEANKEFREYLSLLRSKKGLSIL